MFVNWTKHLRDPEEKANFERQVYSSQGVLDRLKDICIEYEKSLSRSETSLETYHTPNWDYRQAHKNGFRACLEQIKDLVDLDRQKKPADQTKEIQ